MKWIKTALERTEEFILKCHFSMLGWPSHMEWKKQNTQAFIYIQRFPDNSFFFYIQASYKIKQSGHILQHVQTLWEILGSDSIDLSTAELNLRCADCVCRVRGKWEDIRTLFQTKPDRMLAWDPKQWSWNRHLAFTTEPTSNKLRCFLFWFLVR